MLSRRRAGDAATPARRYAHRNARGRDAGSGTSEWDLVVQVAALRRVPGRRAAAARAGAGGRPRRRLAAFPVAAATAVAGLPAATARVQHGHLPVEAANHHLGGDTLLPR